VADKAESQEICFVGKTSYAGFVAARRPDAARPGEIVDGAGTVLGEHKGFVHHTVGQRRGLGIAAREPLYVLRLEPAANRVVVGGKDEASVRSLVADGVAMIDGSWLSAPFSTAPWSATAAPSTPVEVRLGRPAAARRRSPSPGGADRLAGAGGRLLRGRRGARRRHDPRGDEGIGNRA
jgi:tRNA-specific 2-thiouridylase